MKTYEQLDAPEGYCTHCEQPRAPFVDTACVSCGNPLYRKDDSQVYLGMAGALQHDVEQATDFMLTLEQAHEMLVRAGVIRLKEEANRMRAEAMEHENDAERLRQALYELTGPDASILFRQVRDERDRLKGALKIALSWDPRLEEAWEEGRHHWVKLKKEIEGERAKIRELVK